MPPSLLQVQLKLLLQRQAPPMLRLCPLGLQRLLQLRRMPLLLQLVLRTPRSLPPEPQMHQPLVLV